MPVERGKLNALMAAIRLLHDAVAVDFTAQTGSDCHVYNWRPRGQIEGPAIYPWLGDSPHDQADMARAEDQIRVLSRCVVFHSDPDEEMDLLTKLVDSFVYIVDTALWAPRMDANAILLSATAYSAQRMSMRPIAEAFNDVPVLGIELPITVTLARRIRA